jgi:peptidoglycan/xylan/chitin deacetylase (PgdA/CDA1 family)
MGQGKREYLINQPHGLMFHRFHQSGARSLGQGSITETEFEKILRFVGIDRIKTPCEWLIKVKDGCLENQDLCITFDDGLQSQIDVALPILNRYNIKAFWFVYTSVFEGSVDRNEIYNCFATSEFKNFDLFVANFLPRLSLPNDAFSCGLYYDYHSSTKAKHGFYTENDLKFRFVRNHLLSRDIFEREMDKMITEKGKDVFEMADKIWMKNEGLRRLHSEGHTIGLHSYSHPFVMADLSGDEQKLEYSKNIQHITSVIKSPVASMSHPLNSYGPETLDILNSLGVTCGFRSDIEFDSLRENGCLLNLQLPREDSAKLVRRIQ